MGGDQFGEFVCGENLGLKGLIIQYFKLFTCVGQNWVSASLTGLPISNFSYFALLRSISSHFPLISVLTVTADVHVEHSAATNDFNRSVEQKKIDGRMSFFLYIYGVAVNVRSELEESEVSISSDSAYDSVAHDLVKTRL